jgi:diacylglycerol kinase family enzyme
MVEISGITALIAPLLFNNTEAAIRHIHKQNDDQYLMYMGTPNSPMTVSDIIVWKGEVKFMTEMVTLILMRDKLLIAKDNLIASIDLEKEVYAVKVSQNEDEKFILCTLLNGTEIRNFEFLCGRYQECFAWVHLITQLIWFVDDSVPISKISSGLLQRDSTQLTLTLPERRIYCIVNPFGGDKTALEKFKQYCKPILEECPGISTTVVLTEKAGHARELCEQLDLDEWDEVVCAGGDGLLHECLNGLMRHPQWQKAIKIPVCNIPTGTTNALATSVLGERDVSLCAFSIARGFTRPLDVMSFFQDNERTYSFLCLMFGVLANVTHKTDMLRKLHISGLRNKLGFFKELMLKRAYNAKLSFVPYMCPKEDREEFLNNDELRRKDEERDVRNEKYMITRHKLQRSNIYKNKLLYNQEIVENSVDTTASHKDGPDCPLLHRYFPECFGSMNVEKCEFTSCIDASEVQATEQLETYKSVTSANVQTVDEKFFGILACNTSHIAAGFPLGMASYPNSEFVDLAWIKEEKTSRRSLLRHFIKIEQEQDVFLADHEAFEFAKTQCFKLEPLEEGTFISIDGELGKFTTTYVEIHPSMMNYIVL